jgi:hypothetical protein
MIKKNDTGEANEKPDASGHQEAEIHSVPDPQMPDIQETATDGQVGTKPTFPLPPYTGGPLHDPGRTNSLFPESTKQEKEKKPVKLEKVKPEKQIKRQVVSVSMGIEEYEYLKNIFNARKEAGLSENWNQFIKQCINFSVNHEKGWHFGVPKNIKKVYLD